MSNYVKSTNFAVKDTLITGDPDKKIKGTEIDTEYNNIATAVNSKSNTASPALTGTPTVPTATAGTNTTQIASTAFVTTAVTNGVIGAYPVGSIYINASVATNPATLLGFGTWTAFGTGRVLIGIDAGDTSFDTIGETGGSKDAVVVVHTHTITDPGHAHTYQLSNSGTAGGSSATDSMRTLTSATATSTITTGITLASSGSSGTNANLQPYVVVYMWQRTA